MNGSSWNDANGLASRIMVAAGGGAGPAGNESQAVVGGAGGALVGMDGGYH